MALYSICSCVKMSDRAKVLSNMHKIDIMDNKTNVCVAYLKHGLRSRYNTATIYAIHLICILFLDCCTLF